MVDEAGLSASPAARRPRREDSRQRIRSFDCHLQAIFCEFCAPVRNPPGYASASLSQSGRAGESGAAATARPSPPACESLEVDEMAAALELSERSLRYRCRRGWGRARPGLRRLQGGQAKEPVGRNDHVGVEIARYLGFSDRHFSKVTSAVAWPPAPTGMPCQIDMPDRGGHGHPCHPGRGPWGFIMAEAHHPSQRPSRSGLALALEDGLTEALSTYRRRVLHRAADFVFNHNEALL